MTAPSNADELIVAMVMLTPILCIALEIGLSIWDKIEDKIIEYQINKA